MQFSRRIKALTEKKTVALSALIDPGCETRSLNMQRPGNVKVRIKGAQAGGFWRSCRQRRKAV
jgi:hypothetical protein